MISIEPATVGRCRPDESVRLLKRRQELIEQIPFAAHDFGRRRAGIAGQPRSGRNLAMVSKATSRADGARGRNGTRLI